MAILMQRRPATSTLLPLAVLVALAACSIPPDTADYRGNFPVTAKKVTFALDVQVDKGGAISGPEIRRIRGFAREFKRRAQTPMFINTPSSMSATADDGAYHLRHQLIQHGLTAGSISIRQAGSEPKTAGQYFLSFNGFAVRVPRCGDWLGETGFNRIGTGKGNFGCAFQRNFGLMLADPGDLVESRPAGLRTGQEIDRIVGAFREGQATDTMPSDDQTGATVSTVGE